jgi:hypothetical protein
LKGIRCENYGEGLVRQEGIPKKIR